MSRELTHHDKASWSLCSKCHLDHAAMIPRPPPRLKLGYHHHLPWDAHGSPQGSLSALEFLASVLALFRFLSLAVHSHNHAVSFPMATTARVHRRMSYWGSGLTSVPDLGELVGARFCAELGGLSYCPPQAPFCFWCPHSAEGPRASVF